MKTSALGIELIKHFESFFADAYYCPAGVLTIGFGSTNNVHNGMRITKVEAEKMLRDELSSVEIAIAKFVQVPLKQNQFDALASFIYNIGIGGFKNSTLLKKLNQYSYAEASKEFLRWNKVASVPMKGLTRRRRSEAYLFDTGKIDFFQD